uniref:YqjF family protein n=1 Tax=Pedobacter schmidteae TaxID=2201271 RepID=UPI000EABC76E|nr:DUF2071 domain-containing protein [Pedobacter schmidteae]
MSFLTAEWRKLAIANYAVNPELLKAYIPAGTELDLWEGTCYVSLIGFMFKNTRLMGLRIPFYSNFEEVNLRFYVRYKDQGTWKRGVVFIKEIVPKFALAFVANTLYNENYVATAMRHSWDETVYERTVTYDWKCNGKWQYIGIVAEKELLDMTPGHEVEFITEHYWGYARCNDFKTNEYEVKHPRWGHYPVTSYTIDVDFGLNYGPEFAFLNHQQPVSVMLAEGSEISVESKKVIPFTKMDNLIEI